MGWRTSRCMTLVSRGTFRDVKGLCVSVRESRALAIGVRGKELRVYVICPLVWR